MSLESVRRYFATNRPVHALRGIVGNHGKFTKKQSRKTNVFLYISVPISHLVTKHIQHAGGETPILGLPAFLSRSSKCCGARIYFTVKTEQFDQATKITSPLL